jgi:hypothetical protein
MALDPNKLSRNELVQLLNSTALGECLTRGRLNSQRTGPDAAGTTGGMSGFWITSAGWSARSNGRPSPTPTTSIALGKEVVEGRCRYTKRPKRTQAAAKQLQSLQRNARIGT